MKLALALLSLFALVTLSTPQRASAEWTKSSRWQNFCEGALGGWRSFKEEASQSYRDLQFNVRMIVELTDEWLSRFDAAMDESNVHAANFHFYKWAHPAKIAHALNRTSAMLQSLGAMFGSEERRAEYNRAFLAWELQHYQDPRARMKGLKPKYISRTLDDLSIDRMIRRSFPDFGTDPSLRALEVIVSPVVLFEAGKRLPRIHRRPTLLVLRGDLVVKAFPLLEGRARKTREATRILLPKRIELD